MIWFKIVKSWFFKDWISFLYLIKKRGNEYEYKMNKVQNLSASLSSYKMIFAMEIMFKVILLQNVYRTTLLETNKWTALNPQDNVPYVA